VLKVFGIPSQQFTDNVLSIIQIFGQAKKKIFPSDKNLWGKILAKLLISKDSITPFSKGYLVW
jgi:hypothetical protein